MNEREHYRKILLSQYRKVKFALKVSKHRPRDQIQELPESSSSEEIEICTDGNKTNLT